MRIAVSGAHRTGKSTLIERLSEALPDHETKDEPYHLLEEEGYETSEVPALEDFVAQLERSLDLLEEGAPDTLFDRCPADLLAYLYTHEDADDFEPEEWIERIREAMESLDLVVFVPVEERDRIAISAHEDPSLRRAAHEELEELLVEHLSWDVEVLRAEGDVKSRVAQVLAWIAKRR